MIHDATISASGATDETVQPRANPSQTGHFCLTLEGKPVWTSGSGQQFGLGPFILADGLLFAMNDNGLLRLIEATPDKYVLLAQSQVLKGRESWAPLALAGGRLIARDLTRMVCLDVARR